MMRKTLIAFAAASGVACLAGATSASPLKLPNVSSVQEVDWYCGPRCQQRQWEQRRWERQQWRESQRWHNQYYGYNPNYGYYNPNYGYYYR
jgi:hypothetical protein